MNVKVSKELISVSGQTHRKCWGLKLTRLNINRNVDVQRETSGNSSIARGCKALMHIGTTELTSTKRFYQQRVPLNIHETGHHAQSGMVAPDRRKHEI